MTQQTVRVPALCESCHKAYRVTNPARTYACKACGGTVRATDDAETPRESVLAGTVTCSACRAINRDAAHSCVECGAVLEHSLPAPDSEERAQLRHDANEAFKRAYQWMAGVTWLYRLGALAYVLAALAAVMALAHTEVPVQAGVLVVFLTTLLSVMMIGGALHVLFQPFAWTVVVASLATVVSVVHFRGPNPLGLAFPGSATLAVLAWAALVPTWRFRELIAKHKDLYILHHASAQTRRSLKGRTAEERHERLLGAMRRAGWRAWKVSTVAAVAICLASVLGTRGVLSNMRPQTFGAALETFETAWHDEGIAGISELFDPVIREQQTTWLTGATVGHGWSDGLPRLADGRVRETGDRTWVDYELGDFTLSTCWFLNEQVWSLIRIELPVPRLEPAVARFADAWRRSSPEAIAGFFSTDSRENMLASIESSVRDRGWKSFPKIVDTEMTAYDDGDATVTFRLERGKVKTQWHLRGDASWGVYLLKFPSR